MLCSKCGETMKVIDLPTIDKSGYFESTRKK